MPVRKINIMIVDNLDNIISQTNNILREHPEAKFHGDFLKLNGEKIVFRFCAEMHFGCEFDALEFYKNMRGNIYFNGMYCVPQLVSFEKVKIQNGMSMRRYAKIGFILRNDGSRFRKIGN